MHPKPMVGATVVGVQLSGSTQVASHSAPLPPYIVSLHMLYITCIIYPICTRHHILYVHISNVPPHLASLHRPEEQIEGAAMRAMRAVRAIMAVPDT